MYPAKDLQTTQTMYPAKNLHTDYIKNSQSSVVRKQSNFKWAEEKIEHFIKEDIQKINKCI